MFSTAVYSQIVIYGDNLFSVYKCVWINSPQMNTVNAHSFWFFQSYRKQWRTLCKELVSAVNEAWISVFFVLF